jgi:outer membrane immunogenic protein
MRQVLTVCVAVVGRAFAGVYADFGADTAVPPLIAPVAGLMAVLNRHRELFLAAIYVLALTGVAGAADLPFKMPIVAPVPVFSWTGVYLGIGGGTGWGNNEYRWNQDATLAAVAAQMPNPGPLPLVGTTQGSLPISGGFFGGQIGGNWQVEWAVLGIQADAHWADIEGHGSCFDAGAVATAGISFGCNDKVSSFGTVTGRVGAAVDRALIYAKGGWAWEFDQHSLNPTAPFNVMGGNNPQASITSASSNESRTGWTFGAGVEYAFAQHWSAFVEYNYLDFGTKSANSTHFLSLPNNVPPSFVIPIQATATERFNVVKAGLNYRFDWWSTSLVER